MPIGLAGSLSSQSALPCEFGISMEAGSQGDGKQVQADRYESIG